MEKQGFKEPSIRHITYKKITNICLKLWEDPEVSST